MSAKRVLFGWELGDGLGHVSRMIPVARAFRDQGFECVFAIKALQAAYPLLESLGYPVVPAPRMKPPAKLPENRPPVSSMADILALIGFDSRDRLEPVVFGWNSLFSLVKPSLIVSDYAPSLNLAARGRIPTVLLGDGFTIPPCDQEVFPVIRGLAAPVRGDVILDAVQAVQMRFGQAPLTRLPQLFEGSAEVLAVIPELDPYLERRRTPPMGPINPLPEVATAEADMDYFAYLSATHRSSRTVLKALAQSDWKGEVFLRDARPRHLELFEGRLKIHTVPQDLVRQSERARVIIHHGGLNTTMEILARGRPQLFVPRHYEQTMNGSQVCRMGCAVTMAPSGKFDITHVNGALGHALSESRFSANARAVAERLARESYPGLDGTMEMCLSVMQ
jgi:UDP:flavonoid glycosyltransferase YjiC (YdhE family)